MPLTKQHRAALEKFIAPYKQDKNVLGILVTGSVVHSKPDKNSDLDVQVILRNADYRERGNLFIDGIEIEYFINPVDQIRAYFKKEHEKGRHTAHMFCNAVVLFERGQTLRQVQREATKELQSPAPPMSATSRELAQYFIDDLRKDLEDVYIRKDWFAFERIHSALMEECLKSILAARNVKRRDKDKRLAEQLKSIDKKYAAAFIKATTAEDRPVKYRSTLRIVLLTEKLLGGKRPDTWKLRGPLVL